MFFSEFSLKDFGFEFLNYKVVEKIKMWVVGMLEKVVYFNIN